MKKIESGSLAVMLDEETLGLRIEKDGVVWNTDPKKTPELIFAEGTYRFLDAEEISHEVYSFGVGCGIRSRYAGFAGTQYAFETIIWIEAVDETFWMEWIPLCEEGLHPVKVLWPTAMEFTNGRDDWYTLLTEGQGLLIPNTWKTELGKLAFDGRFEASRRRTVALSLYLRPVTQTSAALLTVSVQWFTPRSLSSAPLTARLSATAGASKVTR